jgi:hypothetical protein
MNRIILTTGYLDDMLPRVVVKGAKKAAQDRLNRRDQSLPKITLLEAAFRSELSIDKTQANIPGKTRRLSIFRRSEKLQTETDRNLAAIVGKSVNEVLHAHLPNSFPDKNSKFSNFDFVKCVQKCPDFRQKVLPLISKPIMEVGRLKKRADHLSGATEDIIEKRSKVFNRLRAMVRKRHDEKLVDIDLNSQTFAKIKEAASQIAACGTKIFESSESNRIINIRRERSRELFHRYSEVWEAHKDMSSRHMVSLPKHKAKMLNFYAVAS